MINEKVHLAREFFNIEEYPGNFFEYITRNDDCFEKYGILLFKQDMGKTSGFIGYSKEQITIICINYKRNIGHQNLTLAHEIGHYFLHKGISISDDSDSIDRLNSEETMELEAFQFASELIYPEKFVKEDYEHIKNNKLLLYENNEKLADFVNVLCEKYYISFSFALYRILFTNNYSFRITSKVYSVKKAAGKLSKRYKDFTHVYVEDHPYYLPYVNPVKEMKEYANKLIEEEKISYETGQAILNRHSDLEGYDEVLK